MPKKYDKKIIYIPTDLIGNNITDKIREGYGLETQPALLTATQKLNTLLFGGESKLKFDAVPTNDPTKKKYDFRIENYSDNDKISSFLSFLSKKLKEYPEKPNAGLGLFLIALIGSALAALKLVGDPIRKQDLFYDSSFDAGTLNDKTLIPATDLVTDDNALAAMEHYYKIRSFFNKHVENDLFERFNGNASSLSNLVPTFYKIIEASFYDTSNRSFANPSLFLNDVGKQMKYSISDQSSVSHVAFFDRNTYETFLEACREMANQRLRSVAEVPRTSQIFYRAQRDLLLPTINTDLRDVIPFHTVVEFTTEANSKNGFSFSNFLNQPSIKPFFENFLGLYVDLSKNPQKYENSPWFDTSEEFSIYDRGSGATLGKFDAKVIRGLGLIKDPTFLNFELSKTGEAVACSNVKTKISSLLFNKKVKELMASALDDDEGFFKNSNYSETVCYRITKTDTATGKVVHWFVPNFPGLDVVEIFDSNLRFARGSDQRYEVFALKATIAVEYQYKTKKPYDLSKLSDGGAELITDKIITTDYATPKPDLFFTVEANPAINFIEVPYFTKNDVIVYDSAPAKPNLQFFARRGVDNKMLVLFAGYNDQYPAKKIPILSQDGTRNSNSELYARQHYGFASDENYYKSEAEDADKFEVFVLDKQPNKYSDFSSAKRFEVKNTTNGALIEQLKENNLPYGKSFVIPMEPNKDYWVMARVIDFNGNISDPSTVFKVKIINDDGYINPQISVFDFDTAGLPPGVVKTPSFNKFISVRPAFQHTLVTTDLNNNALVGSGETQPFGKTYKIRFKSKKTNKKFDVNVFFEKKIKQIQKLEQLPKQIKFDVEEGFSGDEELVDAGPLAETLSNK